MLFGGSGSSETYLSRIAAYMPDTDEWTTEGYLLTPRRYAGVITVSDDEFLISGGHMRCSYNTEDNTCFYQQSSEKCSYDEAELTCSYQNPTSPNGKHLSQNNF